MSKLGKGKWDIPRSPLGKLLRKKRLEKKMTAFEVALALGVSEYVIISAEGTKIPNLENLKKLCSYYELDISKVKKLI